MTNDFDNKHDIEERVRAKIKKNSIIAALIFVGAFLFIPLLFIILFKYIPDFAQGFCNMCGIANTYWQLSVLDILQKFGIYLIIAIPIGAIIAIIIYSNNINDTEYIEELTTNMLYEDEEQEYIDKLTMDLFEELDDRGYTLPYQKSNKNKKDGK